MSEALVPDVGPQQIDAVLAHLPILERPGCLFGEWDSAGYFVYSPEVNAFVAALSAQDLLFVFDWPSWLEEAQRYLSQPEALEKADLTTLRMLLTTHVRADRFTEGHLASVLQSGHITAILRRLKEIRNQTES